MITQDGSTLFATAPPGGTKADFVSFSARSGKLQAVLLHAVDTDPGQWYCGILWSDPHGRHLLTQCGTIQASIEGGRSTRIHLPWLFRASEIGNANTFAW